MGSSPFYCEAFGNNAQHAFENARKIWLLEQQLDSLKSCGQEFEYQGYSGSVYGKERFVILELPEGADPREHQHSFDVEHEIYKKWGEVAGCFCLVEPTMTEIGRWAFFGRMAS